MPLNAFFLTMAETEVRFALTPPLAQRLKRHHLQDARGPAEQNETVYYDTPERLLWQHGAEFRVRRNAKGVKQTVKYQAGAEALFAREEAEIELPTAVPDTDHLHASIPASLSARIAGQVLEPVFQTSVTRRKTVFAQGTSQIELAYDQGRITAGAGNMPIHEVELELKDGCDTDLADAALAFLDVVPAGLLTQGKAARGHQLAAGAKPQPVFQDKQELEPSTVLPTAIAAMLRSAFGQALANHAPLLETDNPEAVHQMRVGLRRIRSILSGFRPVLDLSGAEGLLNETKAFFALLGDVREADVFLTETIETFPPDHGGEERRAILEREVDRFRNRVRRDAQDFAAGPAFARLALGWLRWIEGGGWLRHAQPLDRLLQNRPVGQFAAGRLASMNKKLQKRGHRALTGTVDDWHEARIAAKKLRYAGGPLLAVVDDSGSLERTAKGTPRTTKRLAKLQNELGRFNDLCTVAPFLERVTQGVPARSRRRFDTAAAYCSGWCDAQVQYAIPRLEARWEAFEAAMDQQS